MSNRRRFSAVEARGWPALAALVLSLYLGAQANYLLCAAEAGGDQSELTFFRAINLNGPPVTLDGHAWDGQGASWLECSDAAFENQAVSLVPATDDARAQMIRSSRWSSEGRNRLVVNDLPAGAYAVYLYVWEDNNSETFDVLLEGQAVAEGVQSGDAGHWSRLGPWIADAPEGRIELTSSGGHANFSGLEVWRAGPPRPPVDPALVRAFDEQVAPVLAQHCLDCHNRSDKKGGLDLSNPAAAVAGGDSGPAWVAGQPEQSLLWRRIEAGEMPPKAPLPTEAQVALRDWLTAGAAWGTDPIDIYSFSSDRRAGYDWWSLQPLQTPAMPAVKNSQWPAGRIDAFVLAALESRGLEPSPPVDRRVLIRRLTYDLLGLPPTPQEVATFLADESPGAEERLVDRLLDSPHFGEHWARRWLDLVRFGETQGFERNKLWPDAWRYRDWVVEAFNSDLPYDEFVRLQLAGDVLQPDNPLAVVATGQLVVGPFDQTIQEAGTQAMRSASRQEEIEGIVSTVAQTYLGLTVNCARCHDHKFDPIGQRDYYRFVAALAGVRFGERESLSPAGAAEAQRRAAELERQAAELTAPEQAPLRSRYESLRRLLAGGMAHAVTPQQPELVRVLARGDYRQPGQAVTAGGLKAVATVPADFDLPADAPEGPRRAALARWITDPRHPLTARVIVNRLWQYHFGVGLVDTPNDFGFSGGRPSHPELLDWLAQDLMSHGWSLKRMHRAIVLSAAYRQAADARPEAQAIDADNRLLWRKSPRRLEAESLRDSVLAAAGELKLDVGGPGFRDFTIKAGMNDVYEPIETIEPGFTRRSLYRTWARSGVNPLLDVLDCPDPSVATPRRTVTTTPLQALAMFNGGLMVYGAEKMADRLKREAGDDLALQIDLAWRLTLARPPSPDEAAAAGTFAQAHGLDQLCLTLFNCNEFVYVD